LFTDENTDVIAAAALAGSRDNGGRAGSLRIGWPATLAIELVLAAAGDDVLSGCGSKQAVKRDALGVRAAQTGAASTRPSAVAAGVSNCAVLMVTAGRRRL
jgi:hypothetical protein